SPAKHIVKVDGRGGLFKGLAPRLCSSAIGTLVHGKVLQCPPLPFPALPFHSQSLPVPSPPIPSPSLSFPVTPSALPSHSQPFPPIPSHSQCPFPPVLSPPCVSPPSGLIPRLLGDILSLWLCNMLAHLINTYALENGVGAAWGGPGGGFALLPQVSTMTEMKSYSQAVTGFFASMLTYPFVLVSNLMAVNNCGLAGGLLPYAPPYSSWLDCWSQLHREGNMSRGNSLFFR
ncbi:Mitochondrial carrier 2, partial [Calypte anna]